MLIQAIFPCVIFIELDAESQMREGKTEGKA
jgi:hypothetical protein